MKIKCTSLDHGDLVNILSTALYGCGYLSADYDRNAYLAIPKEKRNNGDCFEDKLADMLLNGNTIEITDLYAEGEGYGDLQHIVLDDDTCLYHLDLQHLIDACSTSEGSQLAIELLISEDGDYYTANNLLQIALFGEVIYG